MFAKTLLPEHHPDAFAFGPRCLPDASTGDQPRGLFPERNPADIAHENAVANYAMVMRQASGAEGRLYRTRDGREDGLGLVESE